MTNRNIVIIGCQAFYLTARLQVCLSSDGVIELPLGRNEQFITNIQVKKGRLVRPKHLEFLFII